MNRFKSNFWAAAALSCLTPVYACSAPGPAQPENPLAAQAQSAANLLAARLSIDPARITVAAAEHVTWPNGAAGCPRQGMSYTQALIDGYRIVLRADGVEHHYHGVKNSEPFYCARPGPKSGWIQDR